MIQHRSAVAGEPVVINVVETEEDLDGFREFIRSNLRFLGLDSETTGLDIYSDSFRLRLVQFGNCTESWVIPVEKGGVFQAAAWAALGSVQGFVLQNASYDLQVFDRCLSIPMEGMWPKVIDTKILAHLIDPRGVKEGGPGHSLYDLTKHYVDPVVAENVKTLMRDLAADTKGATTTTIWKKVELSNPLYQLYSGMDPILAARLLRKLLPLVPAVSEKLVPYEHKLAEVCSYMERTGFLLDVDYAKELSATLRYDESRYNEIALGYGCEMVNSTDQVADVLESFGVKIKGRTPSGKRQVNDDLLVGLSTDEDGLRHTDIAQFADAVIEAKKAGKWRKTWVQKFIDQADASGRCHASINPLQARTARMSITGIPAQTLPAGDWTIRRCFLADEGHKIASVDYQTQELRVLAALSQDVTMIQAFKEGRDLHQMTADAAGADRSAGKTTNFTYVYGGGAGKVAESAGISFVQAKKLMDAFAETYPGVAKLSAQLQRDGARDGYVTTPVGRRLPVDPTRAYAALNYVIQSSSRDVTGRALIRLHEAGFTPFLRLPIHDEVVVSLPEDKANWGSARIAEIMAEDMGPVHIGTDPEVGIRSWGSLYGSDV